MMCRDVRIFENQCVRTGADLPAASDPNYKKFEPWLSPGWVPGRKIVGEIESKQQLKCRS